MTPEEVRDTLLAIVDHEWSQATGSNDFNVQVDSFGKILLRVKDEEFSVFVKRSSLLRRRLGEVRDEILGFKMMDVQEFCSDSEQRMRWHEEVMKPLYNPLAILMDAPNTEENYQKGVVLIKQIRAKAEELGVIKS